MQFIYSKDAKNSTMNLSVREYAHIFKVRRVKNGKILFFRNMEDDYIYRYEIKNIDKKSAFLELKDSKILKIEAKKSLHIGWCVVDPKTIEKTLPFLNELGVSKISFVYCDFSQRNFKIDLERINRILINSCQQCGRSSLMQIEILKNLQEFLKLYPDSKIIDFSENKLEKNSDFDSFLVGCEGGFSKAERALFDKKNVVGFENSMILRSETAVISTVILNS